MIWVLQFDQNHSGCLHTRVGPFHGRGSQYGHYGNKARQNERVSTHDQVVCS